MMRRIVTHSGVFIGLFIACIFFFPSKGGGQLSLNIQPKEYLATIELPEPHMDGGKPLMLALKDRKSQRGFSTKKLPLQVLSDLLWAAWGVNRPNGFRTAPSAHGAYEIDIYVTLEEGVFLFDPLTHQLHLILAQDLREETAILPMRGYVRPAPMNLIYVADSQKMSERRMNHAHVGFISQNVYLFCSSEGLATVIRGAVPATELATSLGLPDYQYVTFCQTVGYPAGQTPDDPVDRDMNGDGIVEATSVIVDVDRDGLISVGDTYTHTYEDESKEKGTFTEGHIEWLTVGGYSLDPAGLESAANARENDPRHWSNIQLVPPEQAPNECLDCHTPHTVLPGNDPNDCGQCHEAHL